MKLHIEWLRPIQLTDGTRENLMYTLNHDKLPDAHGLYVFGRKFGTGFEALYVGKANSLRNRVRGQLKNLPLMMHLKKARNGKRILLAGKFVTKPGQRPDKCLPLLERALIRYFLSEGHDLVNKQGTRLRRHEIRSSGKHPKKYIPKLMFVDKAKGG